MKRLAWLAGAVLAPVVLTPAAAQESEESEIALLDPRAQGVSVDELETFADIFVEIEKTSTKYEMELASVASEREARALESQMQRETLETIQRHGWTEEKYEEVNETVNANPELSERALALIEERS